MLKKDKQKVLDEVWTPERIKGFLDLAPPADTDADFHVLYTAYKSMRLEDFEQLLGFFADAGRNFHACNESGENLQQIIAKHRKGGEYIDALGKFAA